MATVAELDDLGAVCILPAALVVFSVKINKE